MLIKEPAITRLIILDRKGEPKTVEGTYGQNIKGAVTLKAGTGIAIEQEDDSLMLSVDTTANVSDPVYQQKWLDIIKGNPPYSGVPYYISSVNGIKPRTDMPLFMLSHLCPQTGVFEDWTEDGEAYYPSPDRATLEVYDMCEACVDCEDYDLIFEYLARIEEWIDANKDNNLITGTQLFKQYQATVHYWNYLVHAQSLVLQFYGSGSACVVKAGYRALGCHTMYNVKIGLRIDLIDPPNTPIMKDWELISVTTDPGDLVVSVMELAPVITESSSSSGSSEHDDDIYSGAEISINIAKIEKGQSVIVTLVCNVAQNSSTEPVNTYRLASSWYNTHLGTMVNRSKILRLQAP